VSRKIERCGIVVYCVWGDRYEVVGYCVRGIRWGVVGYCVWGTGVKF